VALVEAEAGLMGTLPTSLLMRADGADLARINKDLAANQVRFAESEAKTKPAKAALPTTTPRNDRGREILFGRRK
jgi:hypothetical protein